MSNINQVALISRESNDTPLDFQLLQAELEKRGIKVTVLTKLLEKKISLSSLSYIGHLVKQTRAIKKAKVVLLDTYCIPASMFSHDKETKVIQMWHALSAIKQFGWQTVGKKDGTSERIAKLMKMHNGYDSVLCSSDITSNFFSEAFRVGKDKIVKIGLPRIDYILKEDPEMKKKIKARYPEIDNGKKTILYAPTFHKEHPVDLDGLTKAIDFNKYNLIVKLHPIDNSRIDRAAIKEMIIDREFNTYDILKTSDIVISDYSSFVVEASLTNKPIYLYLYDKKDYIQSTGLNVDFNNEVIGKYAFENATDLAKSMESEYDFEALAQFREKYIDIDTNNCTEQLADYIEELLCH